MEDQQYVDEENDSSIMAIFCSAKEFSIACYQEISNSIVTDSISYSIDDLDDVISRVKLACSPTLFLLHPRIISNKTLLDLILTGPDGTLDFYRYKALKSTNWNVDVTREIVTFKLFVRSLHPSRRFSQVNSSENFMKIASVVDVECETLMQTLGALIGYMLQNMLRVDDGAVIVATIGPLPSHNYLRVDESSFK